MKKVLFLIPTLGGGGAERVLTNLVNTLDKSKFDITVQTLFDCGINREALDKDVKYIPGRIKKQFRGNIYVLKLFSPKILYKFFIKDKYNIIISYLEGPTARIVSGCPDKNTRLVNWVHVEQKSLKAAAHAYRSKTEFLKCTDRFDITVCVAKTVENDFNDLTENRYKTTVAYNTVLDSVIKSKADERLNDFAFSDGIKVISVGRLVEEKGFDRLVSAHKKLLDSGIKHSIYVLGGGDKSKLLSLTEKYNVSDTFKLLGFKENPYKYISKCDLFVCSSRREGFSTAVTEALILGLPVVSTCCSGAYELLGENNEYGIVTENSENGIFEGLKLMLENTKNINRYTEKAIERGSKFSAFETTSAVEKLLVDL